ncbi:MAG: PIN domain-containing protein [Brachymonas sp.]|nr:PIN domain-containing protein [Brachymonas sp.]
MLIVDTGFLVALFDSSDPYHRKALPFVGSQKDGWITTWPVVTETMYFLMERVHVNCAIALLDDVKSGALQVWDIPTDQIEHTQSLLRRYKSLPMDFADASLVLLAEHLGSGRILTTDQRDFGAYRWKNRKPFVDVMAIA